MCKFANIFGDEAGGLGSFKVHRKVLFNVRLKSFIWMGGYIKYEHIHIKIMVSTNQLGQLCL